MKTIFDKTTRDELITRIDLLDANSSAQWGKMNSWQMLKHCTLWEEMVLGKMQYKRVFIGRIFGRIALKNVLKDNSPLAKNSPSIRPLIIQKKNGDIRIQKEKWKSLIGEYARFQNPDFIHPFFGKMTKEQIGYIVYKHTDHHLRQFNA